jgi:hypothetical protein
LPKIAIAPKAAADSRHRKAPTTTIVTRAIVHVHRAFVHATVKLR